MKTKTSITTLTAPETTIGIDLGDRKHAISVVNAAGEIINERKMRNERNPLRKLSEQYPNARIVIEVGTHSPWISRFLESLGHEVIVANPRKLKFIYENERKCDKYDARSLAKFGRIDPSVLHPIQHQSEEAQRDLLQIKLRDNIVRQRVDLISAVRGTLKAQGIRLPSPNTNYFTKQARLHLIEDYCEFLELIEDTLEVIDAMTKKIKKLTRNIEDLANEKYPETLRFQQIRGIGPITALSYRLTIDDPKRFKKSRDVGAYLGMVPKRDQSGAVDKQLRISKAGDAYLRRLLVSAAQYMLGPYGEDCDLRRHGLALAERGGQGAKKKAVIAIARKLSVILHTLWISEADYEPLREEVKKAA